MADLTKRLDRVHIDADPDAEIDGFHNTSSSSPWLRMPELPTSAEIGSFKDGKPTKLEYEVPANKIDGPWKDKEDYLQSHYELLRENAVAPLREAVEEYHARPYRRKIQRNMRISMRMLVHFLFRYGLDVSITAGIHHWHNLRPARHCA